ncbi:MAG: ATP-binding protein, partial [Planctomycetota bacterium]
MTKTRKTAFAADPDTPANSTSRERQNRNSQLPPPAAKPHGRNALTTHPQTRGPQPACRLAGKVAGGITQTRESAKRAMMVAAAAHHNLAMIGPPGSGKTVALNKP